MTTAIYLSSMKNKQAPGLEEWELATYGDHRKCHSHHQPTSQVFVHHHSPLLVHSHCLEMPQCLEQNDQFCLFMTMQPNYYSYSQNLYNIQQKSK